MTSTSLKELPLVEENVTETDQVVAKRVEESLNLTSALQRVEEISRNINHTGKAKIEYLLELDDLYHRADKDNLKKILGDHLAKMKVGVVLKRSLKISEKSPMEFEVLLKVLGNYSHASHDIRLQFGRIGILPLVSQCLKHNISNHDMSRASITYCMSILYNCSKKEENKKLLKRKDVMDTMTHYSREKDNTIKMLAILTLSYIADEVDNSEIFTDDSVVEKILEFLKKSLQLRKHMIDGWTTVELVAGLKNLSSNKHNSRTIVKNGGLLVFADIMLNGDCAEKEVAGDTVWMLSFQDENKASIAGDETLMSSLRGVSERPGPGQVTARGILWMVEDNNNQAKEKKVSCDSRKLHIMISYQWDTQELMDRVYEELKLSGYNVWMDIHAMSGSILEAMADAVENAGIILVCMSQKYEDSPNCRTEAEYAFNLHKPIIPLKLEQDYKAGGWLGALLGTKLYINFSSLNSYHGESFEKKMEKLVQEIQRTGVSSVTTSPDKNLQKLESYPPSKTEEKVSKARSCGTGSHKAVGLCTTSHGILSEKIGILSSEELLFLQELKCHAPDSFYRFLSGMMTIEELKEMTEISKAIDDFRGV